MARLGGDRLTLAAAIICALGLGVAGLIATFFAWFSNIVKEAHAGDHTPVVQLTGVYHNLLRQWAEV